MAEVIRIGVSRKAWGSTGLGAWMTNKAPDLPESFAMTHTSEQEENEGKKLQHYGYYAPLGEIDKFKHSFLRNLGSKNEKSSYQCA